MNRDNFYYVLKERLEYTHDYVKDSSAFLRGVDFQKRVEKEFYKDKKILLILLTIINLPMDGYKYYKYYKWYSFFVIMIRQFNASFHN